MSEEERREGEPAAEAEQGKQDKQDKHDGIVETVVGLAVLGLGAALVGGSLSAGGILKGLTRGTPPRTPPIKPL